MKYSTDLLFALAVSAPNSEINGDEAELLVPRVLSPVVTLPGPQPRYGVFSPTTIQRDTFIRQDRRGRAASSAEIIDRICTLGKGLWRLQIVHVVLSNFTQVSDGTGDQFAVQFRDPSDNTHSNLLVAYDVNGVPQRNEVDIIAMLREDSYNITMITRATGVAQTHEQSVSVIASRLL